jgi:glycogen debranching enzyme
MAPDMWTGWGIRTLSAGHPAFNPYNYQTGSVWPHDKAIIAMGFKLYGFDAEAARVAHDVSVAASHFLLNQLPELYTAAERSESNFPVQYLGANVPQAWAAGSVFMLTQALLGFLPDAPRDKLYVDPFLPPGCPTLRCVIFTSASTNLTSASGAKARKRRSRWSKETPIWSSAATLRPRSPSSALARCDSAPQAPARC